MNSKNIFFAFFLFGLLVFACKNKEKTPPKEKSNDEIRNESIPRNAKIAMDTLAKYFDKQKYFNWNSGTHKPISYKSSYVLDNGNSVFIDQKHEPNIGIVSFSFDSLFIFSKSKSAKVWELKLASGVYVEGAFNPRLVDLNGDGIDDIYLHHTEGTGGFPYHFIAFFNPIDSSYVYKEIFSDLPEPFFNKKTKLIETTYDERMDRVGRKERYKFSFDTLSLVDAVELFRYGWGDIEKELEGFGQFKKINQDKDFNADDYSTIVFYKNIKGKKTIQAAWQDKNEKITRLFFKSLFKSKRTYY